MPIYFLLHDARRFREDLIPPLAVSWRQRSFEPCRALCAALAPEAAAFAERYHTGDVEPLLGRVAGGLAFNRHFWKLLVGEVLLYAAAELPEIQTAPDTFTRLLAPEWTRPTSASREDFPPIQQAHFGSRDLVLGSAFYQPETTGFNDTADVERLAEYLTAVDPGRWSAADLAGLPGLESAEDCEEELELAHDWFVPFREMYRRARSLRQVIVSENP